MVVLFLEDWNLATEAIGRSIAVFAGTLKNNEYDLMLLMLFVMMLLALLFFMMMIPVLVMTVILLPVKYDRYGTSISNFSEMFFQCWTCHLGLEVE